MRKSPCPGGGHQSLRRSKPKLSLGHMSEVLQFFESNDAERDEDRSKANQQAIGGGRDKKMPTDEVVDRGRYGKSKDNSQNAKRYCADQEEREGRTEGALGGLCNPDTLKIVHYATVVST